MPLEDFLMPGENVRYSSPEMVEYQGDAYEFCVTDRRLIWYKRTGLIFKSDKVVTENIGDVEGIRYEEKGMIRKKGIIKITTTRKTLEFSGFKDPMRAIYSELQSYMG